MRRNLKTDSGRVSVTCVENINLSSIFRNTHFCLVIEWRVQYVVFGLLLSTALLFAKDSPVALGRYWNPTMGFVIVLISGYLMHIWDRHAHRLAISR